LLKRKGAATCRKEYLVLAVKICNQLVRFGWQSAGGRPARHNESIRRSIPRRLDRRPDDGLQHVARGRRASRRSAPRTRPRILASRPPPRPNPPKGAAWNSSMRSVESCAPTTARCTTARIIIDAARHARRESSTFRPNPGMGIPNHRAVPSLPTTLVRPSAPCSREGPFSTWPLGLVVRAAALQEGRLVFISSCTNALASPPSRRGRPYSLIKKKKKTPMSSRFTACSSCRASQYVKRRRLGEGLDVVFRDPAPSARARCSCASR